MKNLKLISLAAITVVLLGACQLVVPSSTTATTVPNVPVPTFSSQSPSVSASQERLVEIYQTVNPGVVSVIAYDSQGLALGSGFVYDTQGHIITNYHVINGSNDFEVDFPSGLKAKATLTASDADSDLAVLKVDVPASQLHPLSLGDSAKVQVGQTVIAIGEPFGLSGTMTAGIISSKGRTMASEHQAPSGGYFSEGDLLQTDAPINVGNSGGPLVDLNGQVIGVNRALETTTSTTTGSQPGNIGIGFAIPINIVKHVVPILISKGSYAYPYLGMTSLDNLNLKELEALGLPADTNGIYVEAVAAGGPAEKAGIIGGLKTTSIQDLPGGGDVITAVDGIQMTNMSDLLTYVISNKNPGDTISLTILRAGKTMEVKLVLGTRP